MRRYLILSSYVFFGLACGMGLIMLSQIIEHGVVADDYQWSAIKAFIFASMGLQALYTALVFGRLDRIDKKLEELK